MNTSVQAAAMVDVQPILTVRGLKYSYPNGLLALNGLDLDLRPGEIVSVVGPSGCGKSTMLSLISELARPSEGTIEWDHSAEEPGKFGRKLSMVFQRDTVFPWRTVQKNLEFGMECAHLPAEERRERVDSLLRLGRLEAFKRSYPGALSGGMRRRLALLVGLSVNPGVLLLDEPFSALDEPTRIELLVDVLRLVYEYQVSVILVTHDLGEAISVSDRVMVMTNRPATVRRVFDVDFGHDRDVLTIRETARYAELYQEIWHELWTEIRAGRN